MSPETTPSSGLTSEERERIGRLGERVVAMREALEKRIVGLEEVIDQLLVCVFSGGHGLLVGVPGLAKTLLVRSLAELTDLDFSRIQFTPDLMPSDITGTEIITPEEGGEKVFRFVEGPIFANLILADEINRTPPKTQAALMEAMEEGQVTSGGERFDLDDPFYVLATQNPIEQEGTYPLPIAQLDRFMLNIRVGYPSFEEEYEILLLTTTAYEAELEPVLSPDELLDFVALSRKIPISEPVLQYATTLARATRAGRGQAPSEIEEWVSWGSGPRAAQFMILGGKARAMIHGRTEVEAADIRAIAHPVLRHRLILSYHADAEGVRADDVVDALLAHVPAPDGWRPDEAGRSEGLIARLLAAWRG